MNSFFTQGGQTQLHRLRMFKQVVCATLKVSLLIILGVFCLLIYLGHTWQEFWLAGACLKAWFMTNCPKAVAEMSPSTLVYLPDGSESYISDYVITHSAYFIERFDALTFSLIKKALQALIIGGIASLGVSWFWIRMGKKTQAKEVLSGFELVEPKELTKRIQKQGASPYHLANVPIPQNVEYQHFMITGTTGSGKSNALHHLLTQIREQGEQAIVVDTTAGMLARFYNPSDIILNPLDARSCHWNLWGEIEHDYLIEELVTAMIPDSNSQDSFWIEGARGVLVESIKYLRKQSNYSYAKLLDMLLTMPLKDLHARLEHTSVASLLDPKIDKTALSVRATLARYLRVFEYLQDDTQGISLLPFMSKEYEPWIFLSCQPDQRELLRPLLSTQLTLIIKGIMRRNHEQAKRTWIIIDELASLNKLPSLLTGLAELRKYGGCMVLGFQDLSQLENIYGHAATKTLSNLTGTKVLFRCVDSDIANRVSRYLGEQEKREAAESISFGAHQMRDGVSLSEQKQTKLVVSGSQIMMLNDLEAYLKFPQDLPVTKIKFDYQEIENVTQPFVMSRHNPSSSMEKKEESELLALASLAPIAMPSENMEIEIESLGKEKDYQPEL